jgi:NADH dehydrogenase/NADH:ubiquinone oxidoreductase subunit G
MINVRGRIQRLNRAAPPPASARDDWEILNELLASLGATRYTDVAAVFAAMAQRHAPLRGLTLSRIGDLGQPIEAP